MLPFVGRLFGYPIESTCSTMHCPAAKSRQNSSKRRENSIVRQSACCRFCLCSICSPRLAQHASHCSRALVLFCSRLFVHRKVKTQIVNLLYNRRRLQASTSKYMQYIVRAAALARPRNTRTEHDRHLDVNELTHADVLICFHFVPRFGIDCFRSMRIDGRTRWMWTLCIRLLLNGMYPIVSLMHAVCGAKVGPDHGRQISFHVHARRSRTTFVLTCNCATKWCNP